jgi:hypothetical protein
VAASGVTVSESPSTARTVRPSGVTASALDACPTGTGWPARQVPDLPLATTGELDALLGVVLESEWESPAASVGWTCWQTVEHIAGDFAHYAAQIIGQPRDHYVKFGFDTSRATTPDELREVVRVAGGIHSAQ